MCGIAGVIGRDRREDLLSLAESLGVAVRHRGPDGHGLWLADDAGVALAHRRLAVLGLGEQGHQPMTSADGAVTLTFNGEVYNHREHRSRLLAQGCRLGGTSDTEVLVELMAREGVVQSLPAVDGMFALAAWDRRRRRLVLARDRLGEKPLYWRADGATVSFCSEARPLLRRPGAPVELERAALGRYLRRGFVTGTTTIVKGVNRLPPGHWLSIDEDGRVEGPRAWWSAAELAVEGARTPLDEQDAVDAVESALRAALEQVLVADVPVGAFLSGGVDSSLVCALANQVSSGALATFTVGFDQPERDELAGVDESVHAAAVARVLGTDHHDLRVGPAQADQALADVVANHDEPFADPSAVPMAVLCRAARRHVTVCLSGDGADEMFAGYNRYRPASGPLAVALHIPRPLRATAASSLEAVPAHRWGRVGRHLPARLATQLPSDLAVKADKLARVLRAHGPQEAYDRLTDVLDPQQLLLGGWADDDRPGTPAGLSPLRQSLLRDVETTLVDDMLVKVDRASMAVALEVRVPFLHRKVVDVAARTRDRDLVRNGRPKWILREVLSRHVPLELVDRPKRGFDPPLAAWLRGPLRTAVHDLLSPTRLSAQGLLDPEPVSTMVSEHVSGRRDHAYPLWTLLVLQTWLEDVR